MMKRGYACVYRRKLISRSDWQRTEDLAESDPNLKRFLREYLDSFYDWGDDPAFFSGKTFEGNARYATWGVCRTDVRRKLSEGDLVVFFCGKQHPKSPHIWDYFFIGFGTVSETVDRRDIWTDRRYAPYRKFYNVLAELRNGVLVQKETFYPDHAKSWRERAAAPYILFEPSPRLTDFNLTNPLLVATFDGRHVPEPWNAKAKALEKLLFRERGINRRLRTARSGFGHAKLNLLRAGRSRREGRSGEELRDALLELARKIRRTGSVSRLSAAESIPLTGAPKNRSRPC